MGNTELLDQSNKSKPIPEKPKPLMVWFGWSFLFTIIWFIGTEVLIKICTNVGIAPIVTDYNASESLGGFVSIAALFPQTVEGLDLFRLRGDFRTNFALAFCSLLAAGISYLLLYKKLYKEQDSLFRLLGSAFMLLILPVLFIPFYFSLDLYFPLTLKFSEMFMKGMYLTAIVSILGLMFTVVGAGLAQHLYRCHGGKKGLGLAVVPIFVALVFSTIILMWTNLII